MLNPECFSISTATGKLPLDGDAGIFAGSSGGSFPFGENSGTLGLEGAAAVHDDKGGSVNGETVAGGGGGEVVSCAGGQNAGGGKVAVGGGGPGATFR